jgi:peroxiredoxin
MCHLQKLFVQCKDKGLVILGLNCSDDRKVASDLLAADRVTFPNILDTSEAAMRVCFEQYQRRGCAAVPMSYLIDRNGNVVDAWYGGKEQHSRALKVLQKLGIEQDEAIPKEPDAKGARSTK